jgi:putative DNA primase/helicase
MTTRSPTTFLLEAALSYAARGWHVFPCHTATPDGCSCRRDCGRIGKHPRTQHGLKDATTDEATIHHWWRMWPQANIGVATGAVSGLVVLDEDTYKGGDQSRIDLERSYSPLPETVQQLTGGGGVQYFFGHPGTPVKNGVETLGVGLDIRGDGGYIIGPPSLHASGKQYAWELSYHLDETPLAPMPAWLLALCQETRQQEAPSAGEPIPKGHRNDTLFRLGCAMRARGFSEAAIAGALTAINTTQCQPPLDPAEVATIAASCAQYAAGPAQQDPPQRRNGQTQGGTTPPGEPPQHHTSDPEAELEGALPYSDYTNACALVREHGENLHYCHPWKSWLVWRGTHWEHDTTGAVMRAAKQTIKRLARCTEVLEDDQAVRALLAHVKSSLATAKLKAMVESAQSEVGIPVLPEALDADPWVLNCANATLDLRTGTLRPRNRADLVTRYIPVAFDPQAQCPTWEAFLDRIMAGNQNLIGFLQRAVGYALTGVIREHVLFILWGRGRNGKSTFLNTLRALLGPYALKASSELLLVSNNDRHPTERADLFGKRFVSAIETEQGRRLAEVFVKEATGGDPIRARRMREDFWEFWPSHKVFLGTNHKPVIKGTDNAIWERIRLIPFVVTIPPKECDTTLPDTLQAELPGILAWAVRGCLAWQQDGLGEPDEGQQATAGYRTEMDVLGQFITECCLVGLNYRSKASDLYDAYRHWCEQNGEHAEVQRVWGMALTERGFKSYKVQGRSWWRGTALLPKGWGDTQVDEVDEVDEKTAFIPSRVFNEL